MDGPQHDDDGGKALEGDELLRDLLKAIDEEPEVTVTSWEAEFLQNILYTYTTGRLSEKQQDVCHSMIHRYLPGAAEIHKIPMPAPRESRKGTGPSRRTVDTTRSSERPKSEPPKPW